MAEFNRKKLQVFISSTFSDLREQRQAAVEAVLTAGHIPAGMELFTAGDESQMEVIKQWIDESDVYLLILGYRYGSIEPKSGKSYTQLEYEYALSKEKPLFACVVREEIRDSRVRLLGAEILELSEPNKLKDFRAFVLSKMCKFWEDSKDIKITVSETLALLAKRDGLIGWVRPDTQSNVPALADELARLSAENAALRQRLQDNQQDTSFGGLSFAEMKNLLEQDGTLNYLVQSRKNLSTAMMDSEELRTLRTRGLILRNERNYYILSPTGCAFLNKLDMEKVANNQTQNTPTAIEQTK